MAPRQRRWPLVSESRTKPIRLGYPGHCRRRVRSGLRGGRSPSFRRRGGSRTPAAHQCRRIRCSKLIPSRHGDVDDTTVSPTGGLVAGELVGGGPSGRLPMETAAIFHHEPFRSDTDPAPVSGHAQATVGETWRVTCDCASNARSARSVVGLLSGASARFARRLRRRRRGPSLHGRSGCQR